MFSTIFYAHLSMTTLYDRKSLQFLTIYETFLGTVKKIWTIGRMGLLSFGDFQDFYIKKSKTSKVFLEIPMIFGKNNLIKPPNQINEQFLVQSSRYRTKNIIADNIKFLKIYDYNECNSNYDDCDMNSICENNVGSFSCSCPVGYFDSFLNDLAGRSCELSGGLSGVAFDPINSTPGLTTTNANTLTPEEFNCQLPKQKIFRLCRNVSRFNLRADAMKNRSWNEYLRN